MKSKLFTSVLSVCVTLMLISGSSVNAEMLKKNSYVEKKGITIEYFGHSSFGISDSDGMKIVTDPYDPILGYTFPSISTQILTVSHDHFDHNNVAALKGYKQLINATTGSFTNGDIKVRGFASWHDTTEGSERGPNTIYTYEINKIKVCHLGDLGHELSAELIKSIGEIDVLMIPVGGTFTINSDEAIKVINSINPKIVIPMHYGTDVSRPIFEDYLAPVDDFTSKIKLEGWEIENIDNLTLTKQMLNTLKSKKVFVLNYN
ncbi:MBL fold metallo-hydrolase [Clostridium estertheticum]|uniref:MBL fold metallo-hydrolase n=1 Tax=Clostridium estertheticum TaxID=238834 RepID=UPI0013E963E7|nr:MBL fold metallo-hydrolase [Clostridium estertheticum]MBZ9687378.1 MBL fold metallo-hydrolase [Clostridium estertheticum]